MKKACKELMEKNNEREKEILKSNDEIYTDMIVYLRASDITEYNQEQVREDLINMIIDGQNRGDDIEKVMGGNYQEICNEIIESMPKKTAFQKVMCELRIGIMGAWILGIISIVKQALISLIQGKEQWDFVLTMGDIASFVFIIFLASMLVKGICRDAFKRENKAKKFIKDWIMWSVIIGIMVVLGYFLKFTVIDTTFSSGVIMVAALIVIERAFNWVVDEKIL